MRLYLLPHGRLRAYGLCLVFIVVGVIAGFARTSRAPLPQGTSKTPLTEARAAGPFSVSGGKLEAPDEDAQEVGLVRYTVLSGDTLTSIAERFNTSADSIAHTNDIPSPDRISVGAELLVMRNAVGVVVKVGGGDTLSEICGTYGVSIDDIVKVNKLAGPGDIFAGQLLLLPGATVARSVQTLSRSSSLMWPAKGPVSSSFGWRIHPVSGENSFHEGIDIAAANGSSVWAAGSGEVVFAGWYAGYGRLVTVDHGGNTETRYGHLSGFTVKEGDLVHSGDVIGYVGQSGTTTGPNLHFEVRKNSNPVNPRTYLP